MRVFLLYIYTFFSYLILHSFTAFIVLCVLFFNLFKLNKIIAALIRIWASCSFCILGKSFKIEGKENLNRERKYILMANHASLFDIMGIMTICPKVSWFGRAYLTEIPVFGRVLNIINYVPMKTIDLKNTKRMVDDLIKNTSNQTVAIFPEGTRTKDGELSRFRKGFLHVMKASQLDILPVTLNGFYEFKPKHRFYFDRSVKLSALIHQPISFESLKDLEDLEIIELVRTKIESALKNQTKN